MYYLKKVMNNSYHHEPISSVYTKPNYMLSFIHLIRNTRKFMITVMDNCEIIS